MPKTPVVYLVDDDPGSLKLVAGLVEEAGWRCRSYSSPEQFLEECSPQMRGCLVLDLS